MKLVPRFLLKLFARVARPYLSSYGLLLTAKVFNRSALVWSPEGGNVVVLAPHMDDEVIGCGGTLSQHVEKGARITVIFLTDGAGGGSVPSGRSGSERSESAQSLTEVRRAEARAALAELSISNLVFLDARDGEVGASPGLSDRLRQHLMEIRPDLVYLPFFLEEHPDHRAASQVLLEATRGSDLSFRCFGYEVWTPLFPNCLVNIDATVELKKKAIAHYQSQLAESNYLHTAIGLNAYRSSAMLNNCRFAEAFCALSLPQYLELYRAYGQRAAELH
jgi:LmbE family N-acetylglucosaminyl deacetylase